MEREGRIPEELLLDFHLDRLTHEDCSWIEAELRRDAELRLKSDRLGRVLQPLDHAHLGPAPINLANNVLSYIARATNKPLTIPFPADSGGQARFPFVRMRDLIAAAACLLLLVGVGAPGVSELRDRSQRALCANNLRSIFQGASAYRQAFADSLPYAGGIARTAWLPGGDSGIPYASNSRHPFLLVKFNFGPKPKDFICPGESDAEAMLADQVAALDDFGMSRNISYDSLNLAGASPNLRPPPAIAYLSDTNPLFVGAKFNETVDPNCTNSAAHRGRGQSVLTLAGSVQFVRSPIYDGKHDNLWTIGDVRRYRGTESPTRRDDAFLVPGYPITDPMVRASYKH